MSATSSPVEAVALPAPRPWLRFLFFALVVRPLVLIVLGLNLRHRERLPGEGPALVVANHNSHLDTLVLMSLFPLSRLGRLRPVAAADHFKPGTPLGWLAREVLGAVLVERSRRTRDPLAGARAALERGDVLILYPEGTRGEPERLSTLKSGVAHLVERHPGVPVVPVFLHGLGKALPKGDWLPVPFFCDVFVGEPVPWRGSRDAFMGDLTARMEALADEGHFQPWE